MANFFASVSGFGKSSRTLVPSVNLNPSRGKDFGKYLLFLAAILIVSTFVSAQAAPQVTAVDPASGKVNDTVTLSGSNLGKATVNSVYLSDDKNDYKATIVDQSDDKIAMKIPQVKAGDYNVSVMVGEKLFIKPVKFKVQE